MQCSKISWLNGGNTFNPWIGCTPVSAACANCYAKRENARRGWCADFYTERHVTSDAYWRQPLLWNKRSDPARPTLVFCGSMCDVFERDTALVEPRRRLADLVMSTPNLLWLFLTKRPENIRIMERSLWGDYDRWPENVWCGCTVENQKAADERLPYLLDIPCGGRFVSCEPLLGMVDLEPWLHGPRRLDWVIAGGERGPRARETTGFQFEWLWEKCQCFGIPFFFKQFGDAFAKSMIPGSKFFSECQQFPERFGIK